ncbi:MAG: dipicolinate synthase subunit B [Acutalibacteraceae bacterium]
MIDSLKIGFCLSGSFCTFERVLSEMRHLLADGASITPILSFNAASLDTRFGRAQDWRARIEQLTGQKALTTLTEVEPIGPKGYFDVLIVAPCTGSTLGRLANGISDTPVTLAVKSHLRRSRPVVLAVSTNDALGASLRNIALLKNTKHLYFVPMEQDDVVNKPNSLVADFSRLGDTVACAMTGLQLQPLFTVSS